MLNGWRRYLKWWPWVSYQYVTSASHVLFAIDFNLWNKCDKYLYDKKIDLALSKYKIERSKLWIQAWSHYPIPGFNICLNNVLTMVRRLCMNTVICRWTILRHEAYRTKNSKTRKNFAFPIWRSAMYFLPGCGLAGIYTTPSVAGNSHHWQEALADRCCISTGRIRINPDEGSSDQVYGSCFPTEDGNMIRLY